MAARRGKSQARRNSGGNGNGTPAWAWAVLGALVVLVAVVVGQKYLKQDGDGFYRLRPNPDAQPAPVTEEDVVAPGTSEDRPERRAASDEGAPEDAERDGAGSEAEGREPEYDFYTVLPGKEVPLSDAEIAASERAEERREAERAARDEAASAATAERPTADALPQPIDEAGGARRPTSTVTAAAAASRTAAPSAPVDDGTRYLLQAGAFAASGQAEEMKARIALLGLGARVEAAQIGGKTVYRVRMGPYGTASDLADAKRKLAAGGLSALAIKVK